MVRRLLISASVLGLLALPQAGTASHKGDSLNDLWITHVTAPAGALEGSFVEYVLRTGNRGPHPAQNVVVTHMLDGAELVSVSGHRWECFPGAVPAQTVCRLHGSIPAGAAADPIRLVGLAPSLDEDANGTIVSAASVGAHGTETQPGDETSIATTTLRPGTDLSISQTDDPDRVTSNLNVRYVAAVVNNGDATATGVAVTEALSAGSVESAGGEGWTCSTGAATARCTLDAPLASGAAAAPIAIIARAPKVSASSTMTATATVTTDNEAGDANNTDVEETTVLVRDGKSATGYIPPQGGYVTTHTSGDLQSGGGASSILAAAAAADSTLDLTYGEAVFPAGPGGVASLFEHDERLTVCQLPTSDCAGAALDVIVPPGYDDSTSPIVVNLVYDESLAPPAEDPRTVYVEKPVRDIPTTLPLVNCELLGVADPSPCLDAQERNDDGDLVIRILMLSQDPRYQG